MEGGLKNESPFTKEEKEQNMLGIEREGMHQDPCQEITEWKRQRAREGEGPGHAESM